MAAAWACIILRHASFVTATKRTLKNEKKLRTPRPLYN